MTREEQLKKAIDDVSFAERSRGPTSDLAIQARSHLENLQKAFSDEARAAAAEARKKGKEHAAKSKEALASGNHAQALSHDNIASRYNAAARSYSKSSGNDDKMKTGKMHEARAHTLEGWHKKDYG